MKNMMCSFVCRWEKITDMAKKRYYASSTLDKNGNLWVLGGTANSTTADSTEVYEYKSEGKGRWRKGYPLPVDYR